MYICCTYTAHLLDRKESHFIVFQKSFLILSDVKLKYKASIIRDLSEYVQCSPYASCNNPNIAFVCCKSN